jgi:integrase
LARTAGRANGKSASLRAYQRRTKAADALIAGAYLSGTNTRRVRRALAAVFAGPVGKDVVKSFPTLAQVREMLDAMPRETEIEKRDHALVAFAILSGARDRAIISFRL